MGKAADTMAKAEAKRGRPFTKNQVALEDAREKLHAKKGDKAAAKAFKDAARKVHAERKAAREQREAEGPPAAAPGDAVVRLGGQA
jgi:hypothetical protein